MTVPTLPVQGAWSDDCCPLRALTDGSSWHPAESLPRSHDWTRRHDVGGGYAATHPALCGIPHGIRVRGRYLPLSRWTWGSRGTGPWRGPASATRAKRRNALVRVLSRWSWASPQA